MGAGPALGQDGHGFGDGAALLLCASGLPGLQCGGSRGASPYPSRLPLTKCARARVEVPLAPCRECAVTGEPQLIRYLSEGEIGGEEAAGLGFCPFHVDRTLSVLTEKRQGLGLTLPTDRLWVAHLRPRPPRPGCKGASRNPAAPHPSRTLQREKAPCSAAPTRWSGAGHSYPLKALASCAPGRGGRGHKPATANVDYTEVWKNVSSDIFRSPLLTI